MDWLRHDLRHALRLLAHRPGFSALAILALALGLGVNTVAFSAVNALLYKSARFPSAETAGWLFVGTPADPLASSSIATLDAIEAGSATLETVAAQGRLPLAWQHDGETDEIWSLVVSADYFAIDRVTPLAGRLLARGDGTRGDAPVLVAERFWRRRLGSADPASLSLALNGRHATVVGILPDGYQGPGGVFEPDVWIPLDARRTLNLPARYDDPAVEWLDLLAAPAAGATVEAIRTEVEALTAGTAPMAAGVERRVTYQRFADGHPELRDLSPVAGIGLVAVGSVLLIACFNVAGLMLARAMERRRDLSVCAALGASRWRLARSLLTEGLVFAAIGGAAALLLASWSASLLAAFSLPAPIPQRLHFVTDWRLVSFSVAAALLAALVPALAPMWQLGRADLAQWARVGSTAEAGAFGQRRSRRGFVLLQIAGSTLFLATALVTVNAFRDLWRIDAGYDTARTAVLTIAPAEYGHEPGASLALAAEMADRLSRVPGVEAVGVANRAPFGAGAGTFHAVSADGHDCAVSACERAGVFGVDAGYFRVRAPGLIAGAVAPDGPWRTESDAVAVVNEAAARRLWPDQTPIGKSFRDDSSGRWHRVIGVMPDARLTLGRSIGAEVFLPLAPDAAGGALAIIARSATAAPSLLGPMRDAARLAAPAVPVQSAQTMAERMALPFWLPRTTISFFGVCALLAVVLSSVGLFGVTYYAINQRRREFGVRAALGASAADVRRLVLAETARLAAPGVVLGLLLAVGIVIVNRSALVNLQAPGALPFLAAGAVQVAVAMAAAWSPARRAARANPLDVLRSD
jgi:predicted permease